MDIIGVGPLKQVAIDAWMRDKCPYPCLQQRQTPTEYLLENDTSLHVSRPDENGQGGGVVTDDLGNHLDGGDLCSYFDAVFAEIDHILNPFMFTANPDDFAEAEATLGPAANALITSEAGGGLGQGLSDPINNARSYMSGFQSAFLDAFSHTYLSRLQDVVAAYYGICVELGAALGGEEGLWQKTPDAVNSAVHSATLAFQDHARQVPVTWDEVLEVTKVMLEGITVFTVSAALLVDPLTAPAGIAALLSGVTFVSDAGVAAATTPPGPSFDSIMQAFSDSIGGIVTDTRTQEEIMNANLIAWCGSCSDGHLNLSNQLAGEPIDSSANWRVIDADLDRCRALFEVHGHKDEKGFLVQVKDGLHDARQVIESLTDTKLWYRDDRLGIGSRGYWQRWDELRWILRDLLADLEWQTEKAIVALRDIVAAFEDHDASAATRLGQLSGELDVGSGYLPTALPPDWPTGPHRERRYDGIGGY